MTQLARTLNPSHIAFFLLNLLILTVSPALSDEVAPPAPPAVDAPPPPPSPVTLEPDLFGPAPAPASADPAVVRAEVVQPVAQPAPAYQYGDPYGFTAWLNGVRGQYGLGAVGFDANLSYWAAANNGQQQSRGLGHHVMGPARRQNSGMGAMSSVCAMWMASPAHQAALLDPTITAIGIAAGGSYWTFNAY